MCYEVDGIPGIIDGWLRNPAKWRFDETEHFVSCEFVELVVRNGPLIRKR